MRLWFGKYKGKTVRALIDDTEGLEYIAYWVVNRVDRDHPATRAFSTLAMEPGEVGATIRSAVRQYRETSETING